MHFVISNAAGAGSAFHAVLPRLPLPHLQQLLSLLTPTDFTQAPAQGLTPVAERVLARCAGLAVADGLVPWAALEARQEATALGLAPEGLQDAQAGWGTLNLCHWKVNADHVQMGMLAELGVTAQESQALLESMRSYFAEDGLALHALRPGTWLVRGAALRGLATASLARVQGSAVDAWIPRQPQAQVLRRLQNEMQMLLYTHRVNDARSAQQRPAINAFWISGTGDLPVGFGAAPASPAAQHVGALDASAWQGDATAWAAAWRDVDATVLAQMLRSVQGTDSQANQDWALTLCGPERAQTFALRPQSLWTRLQRRLRKPSVAAALLALSEAPTH